MKLALLGGSFWKNSVPPVRVEDFVEKTVPGIGIPHGNWNNDLRYILSLLLHCYTVHIHNTDR